jgi:hypothetical protein
MESRKVAIKAVASQWIMSDSKAAMDWMGNLADLRIRKEVSQAMAESLVGNPEFINDSILQNGDPQIREELEQQIDQLQLDAETEK